MNSEGRHERSADDVRKESAADGGVAPTSHAAPSPSDGVTRAIPTSRDSLRPDDRQTMVIPPVRDAPPQYRDPIDVVKAAMDGTPPPPRQPPPGPPPGGRPPGGPGPRREFHVNWKWVRRGSYIALALCVLLPIVTFAMAYVIVDIPKPGDIRTNQVSTILASDGSELAKIVPPEGNRVDVNIDQVPVQVRNAVMAAEDRDFYTNPGFSFTGFLRAFKNNIFGGDLQGGSTITQQYVKNALVGDARSGVGGLVRKAKELVISTKMSGDWSKDQVLQSYLNIIYFGRGAYGISAASTAYFGKPVEQLNVAEGALLAALIQQPSALDPAVDPAGSAERWNWVLDGMVRMGALSPSDRAAQVFPPTVSPDLARAQNQTTGPNGLIERQVTKELMDLFNIDEQTLNTEGLQVTTTIDPKAQQSAEDAVAK
ncbi:MAG: transglycosylase domain-containing protein, partial [Myxococcota bacterium]